MSSWVGEGEFKTIFQLHCKISVHQYGFEFLLLFCFTMVRAVHWTRTASIDMHGTILCPARTKWKMYDAKTVCLVVWRWWWHSPILSVLATAGFIMSSKLTNTIQVSVSLWLASSWFWGLDWLWLNLLAEMKEWRQNHHLVVDWLGCIQIWQRWKNKGKASLLLGAGLAVM